MVAEDLDFVQDLSMNDKQGIFANASHTLFRVRSLISVVVVDQYNIMGSSVLLKEWDGLNERCETLEQDNSDANKELAKLRANTYALGSL